MPSQQQQYKVRVCVCVHLCECGKTFKTRKWTVLTASQQAAGKGSRRSAMIVPSCCCCCCCYFHASSTFLFALFSIFHLPFTIYRFPLCFFVRFLYATLFFRLFSTLPARKCFINRNKKCTQKAAKKLFKYYCENVNENWNNYRQLFAIVSRQSRGKCTKERRSKDKKLLPFDGQNTSVESNASRIIIEFKMRDG